MTVPWLSPQRYVFFIYPMNIIKINVLVNRWTWNQIFPLYVPLGYLLRGLAFQQGTKMLPLISQGVLLIIWLI